MTSEDSTSSLRDTLLTVISRVRPEWVELLFLSVLSVGILYQVVRAFGYPRLSGLFPLIVGIPTLGLLLYIEITDVLLGEESEPDSKADLEDRLLLLQGVFWTMLLLALVYTLGLVIGAAIFLVVYYRTKGTPLWKLGVLTGIFLTFAIVVFQIVLQIPLYRGLLNLPQTIPI